ncbi:hypothetical protein ACA910_012563 [Epithemia clementina (nom. ined.)]
MPTTTRNDDDKNNNKRRDSSTSSSRNEHLMSSGGNSKQVESSKWPDQDHAEAAVEDNDYHENSTSLVQNQENKFCVFWQLQAVVMVMEVLLLFTMKMMTAA